MVAGIPTVDKGKGIANSEAKGNSSQNPHPRSIDLNVPNSDPLGPLRNGNSTICRPVNEACENQSVVLGLPAKRKSLPLTPPGYPYTIYIPSCVSSIAPPTVILLNCWSRRYANKITITCRRGGGLNTSTQIFTF